MTPTSEEDAHKTLLHTGNLVQEMLSFLDFPNKRTMCVCVGSSEENSSSDEDDLVAGQFVNDVHSEENVHGPDYVPSEDYESGENEDDEDGDDEAGTDDEDIEIESESDDQHPHEEVIDSESAMENQTIQEKQPPMVAATAENAAAENTASENTASENTAAENTVEEELSVSDFDVSPSTSHYDVPPKSDDECDLVEQVKKITKSLPLLKSDETGGFWKPMYESAWSQPYYKAPEVLKPEKPAISANSDDTAPPTNAQNIRRDSSAYVQEVNRAIYGSTTGFPAHGTTEYFRAAENYAVYGQHFFDFPKNLVPFWTDLPPPTVAKPPRSIFESGLYPTATSDVSVPVPVPNCQVYGNSMASAVTHTNAYQMYSNLQPSVRPTTTRAVPPYGQLYTNRPVFPGAAQAPPAPQLIYNQSSTASANFITKSLANVSLNSPPSVLYSNTMINSTTSQQYLNTYFKETHQYMCTGTTGINVGPPQVASAVAGSSSTVYERFVYAQMLQNQILHNQTQQQAAAVATVLQNHNNQFNVPPRARTPTTSTTNSCPTPGPATQFAQIGVGVGYGAKFSQMKIVAGQTADNMAYVMPTVNYNGSPMYSTASPASICLRPPPTPRPPAPVLNIPPMRMDSGDYAPVSGQAAIMSSSSSVNFSEFVPSQSSTAQLSFDLDDTIFQTHKDN